MVEQAKRKAAEARDAEYKEAAARAGALWNEAGPAPAAHAYLVTKGITPDGARIGTDGRLIVPVFGPDGLQSLQFIAPDAVKRFLTGGKMKGGNMYGWGRQTGRLWPLNAFSWWKDGQPPKRYTRQPVPRFAPALLLGACWMPPT